MKVCNKCDLPKDESEFPKRKINKDGLYSYCKTCKSSIGKEYSRTKEGLLTKIYSGQKTNSKVRGNNPPSYSKEVLGKWLFEHPDFEKIYNDWVISGYDSNLTPSIDRLNDNEGYSFDNIQLMTWEENKEKGHKDRKSGANNKVGKKVIGIKTSDNSSLEFHSISDASRKTGINRSNINGCCLNKKGFDSAGGYYWKYKIIEN